MHVKGSPHKKYAVKIYSKHKENEGEVRHFKQECEFLQKLDHPYIIKLLDYKDKSTFVSELGLSQDVRYSILELASNGNLLNYVINKPMNECLIRYYFR